MYNAAERKPHYKGIAKSKMSRLISMYLEAFSNELISGNAVGYPSCYFQIVETENFNIRLDRQNFLSKAPMRNLGKYDLGPLNKKIFIKLNHRRDSESLVARAIAPFNKMMYKAVMNNTKFQKHVG